MREERVDAGELQGELQEVLTAFSGYHKLATFSCLNLRQLRTACAATIATVTAADTKDDGGKAVGGSR